MKPYADLSYFVAVLCIVGPIIIAGAAGRAGWRWTALATIVMLVLQYTTPLQIVPGVVVWELVALVSFGIYLFALAQLALKKVIPKKSALIIPLGLLPLVVAKYVPLGLPNFEFGFLGISYVTFRALDVLWLITDGVLAEVGLLDFLMFLFFFPTISSGPIDRFRRFQKEWRAPRSAEKFWDDIDAGVHLVFRGLLYKFVIDTVLERQLLHHVEKTAGIIGAVEYAYAYTAHLFFDFAGYSALAIGVGRFFGITSPANFNKPFAAQNIRDFWNRWHMSLSFWFRDHVYTRFLLTAVKGKRFKKRETPANLGYFVSFGLMGLWHLSKVKPTDDSARLSLSLGLWAGVTWHHLFYGIYHAALFNIFDAFTRWKKRNQARLTSPNWKWAAHFLTIQCVVFGFWLFSGHGVVSEEMALKMRQDAEAAQLQQDMVK